MLIISSSYYPEAQAEISDNLKYTRKTLFCNIIEPHFGRYIPIEDWMEDMLILENNQKNAFNIRGISQKNSTNQLYILTHAPKIIEDFQGIVEADTATMHLYWTPRQDVFKPNPDIIPEIGAEDHYDEDIVSIIDEQANSDIPDTPPIQSIPSNYERIIERNETWELPATPLPTCQRPPEEISCSYTPAKIELVDNCSSDAPCPTPQCVAQTPITKTGTCNYPFTCSASWWGTAEDRKSVV